MREAINSVLRQTYKRIQLIVVDDGSVDGGKAIIQDMLAEGKRFEFVNLPESLGNCRAFNKGLEEGDGDFFIDLAADDILLPQRVEEGINDFANAPEQAGVQFSDAFLTDKNGKPKSTFYDRKADGQLRDAPPSGDIFEHLITRHLVLSPTMMVKRVVMEALKGYDENLLYEDFDFCIRSSRKFHYIFNRAPLIKKRILKSGLSSGQNKWRNPYQKSTLQVCEKILTFCDRKEEYAQLARRCYYEIRRSIQAGNIELVPRYFKIAKKANLNYRRLSDPSSIDK